MRSEHWWNIDLTTVGCDSVDGRHQISDENDVAGPTVAVRHIPWAGHADIRLRIGRELVGRVPGKHLAANSAHRQEVVGCFHLSYAATCIIGGEEGGEESKKTGC